MEAQIVETMKQLGFTANASRAYLALLRQHPATGYELAARSKVPRSAIYNVLRRLETDGFVNVLHGKPARYVPLPPDQLIDRIHRKVKRDLETAGAQLKKVSCQMVPASTWTVTGYAEVLDRARELVEGAKRSVYVSLWGREATLLADTLRQAVAAGRDVVSFSFTVLPDGLGRTLSYGLKAVDLEPHWAHKIILIIDSERVLVGGAEEVPTNRAVVTEEAALVEMASSNLILDVTLFGQRFQQDVSDVVSHLTGRMAPVDELLRASALS